MPARAGPPQRPAHRRRRSGVPPGRPPRGVRGHQRCRPHGRRRHERPLHRSCCRVPRPSRTTPARERMTRVHPRRSRLPRSPNMTTTSNQDLIGREGVNDLDAILAMTNTDIDSAVHAITDNAEAIFTWDYEKGARPGLNKLYEKAKT